MTGLRSSRRSRSRAATSRRLARRWATISMPQATRRRLPIGGSRQVRAAIQAYRRAPPRSANSSKGRSRLAPAAPADRRGGGRSAGPRLAGEPEAGTEARVEGRRSLALGRLQHPGRHGERRWSAPHGAAAAWRPSRRKSARRQAHAAEAEAELAAASRQSRGCSAQDQGSAPGGQGGACRARPDARRHRRRRARGASEQQSSSARSPKR